jgi:hypothetical protein
MMGGYELNQQETGKEEKRCPNLIDLKNLYAMRH